MFLEEKKVEYFELIYDLIFVYLIGRSNELLHEMEGGFFTPATYLTYILSTAVILQIWYQSTLFINRYGSKGLWDFIGLFINMYLLYYMAGGIRAEWSSYYMRFNIAWGLILINLAIHYYIKYRSASEKAPWEMVHIRTRIILLLIQTAMIFLSIPVYQIFHIPLSWLCLAAGFLPGIFTRHIDALVPVNFEHLTERVMLYIVLTFGEMIVSITGYFETPFSFNTLYFSLLTFLIVAGLFLSYGYMYDIVIDRTMHTSGTVYMLFHIVLLLALNNISAGLEFMRDSHVSLIPKNIFITASFLLYYLFLLLICRFSGKSNQPKKMLILAFSLASVVFAGLMMLFYNNGYINLAVSVLYVFSIFILYAETYKKSIFAVE